MQTYLYLSSFINMLLAISALFSMHIITNNKLHKGVVVFYVLFHGLFIYLTYLNQILSFLLIIFFTFSFHYFLNKKQFIINGILYFFFYYGISLVLVTLSSSLKLINGGLFLTSSKGILICLLIPLFALMMLFSSMFIDKTFHLHNYQDEIYLTIGEKTVELKGYFDTGNTLIYKNTPVIFISNLNNPFNENEFSEEINFETLSSTGKTLLAKGLVSKKGDNESYFVYVATNYNHHNYHGCELLLNAYLF